MNESSTVIQFPQRDANRPSSGARERITPQSYEAEQSTLGAMLMERDAIARAVELLAETDFYREMHRRIYTAILALFDKGEPVDLITAKEELARRGWLDEVGGTEYLAALIYECPSAANVESYARAVQEKSVLRQLASAADSIMGAAYGDVENVGALVDESEKKIFEISSRRMSAGFSHIKPLLMTAFDQIEHQFKNKGQSLGLSTGFPDLDEITSACSRPTSSSWRGGLRWGKPRSASTSRIT